ncbi:MdtL family multidrug efflux MFS transporter [Aeromonas jandaei]|uniref:MdtL family multidrug efflux MFS transporter n=1 Tax=Aeromonas jandaei TaxID=650 RepID=A0A7T4ABM1_AERJA|nr:MdtL family multidrug efflux MFS transporter [Aeromonas jandaei]QQB20937.1 MdtL family multidrug efflux MFS transporter [Aeromonas jandaei]UCA31746.1 MdtL family multidrug efflux MFS transporter [Aeromonas jandaei]
MRTFLLCAFLMIILYPVGIDLYLVAVPRIAESLQANEAQIHTAFSIYLFGMAATVLLGGMIADRYGRRPVVLGGAIIFLAASLVAANATDVIHFYLGRFWQGVGAGSLYIMTFTVLRDVLNKERLAMALSMINGVICVIPVLAPVLGYLILSRFAWQGIFVVMALVAALTGLVNMVLLKETRPASSAVSDSRLPFELLRSARFMLLSLLTSASVTAILVYVSVSPLILMQELGFSPEQYSVVMMVMAGVSMSTSFLMPLLLRLLGKQRMLAVSHLAYLLAALLLLGSLLQENDVRLLLTAFALVCVGFSCGFGVAMGEALDGCQHNVAFASAVLCVMQISLSGLYIWLMGQLGFTPSGMLFYSLLLTLLSYLAVKGLVPWFAVREAQSRG